MTVSKVQGNTPLPPKDILVSIFFYLDDIRDIIRCMSICKSWKEAVNDERVWKEFFTRDFPSKRETQTWKEAYINNFSLPLLFKKGNFEKSLLTGHQGLVQDISFDGKFLISSSSDKTLRVWGWQEMKCLKTLELNHKVGKICIEKERIAFISGPEFGIWDWKNDTCLFCKEHEGDPTSIIYQGDTVVTGSVFQKTVSVWSVDSTKFSLLKKREAPGVTCVAFQKEEELVVYGAGPQIFVWKWNTDEMLQTYTTRSTLCCIVVKEDLIAFSNYKEFQVLNWKEPKPYLQIDIEDSSLRKSWVALQGNVVVLGGGKSVKMWNWNSSTLLRILEKDYSTRMNYIAYKWGTMKNFGEGVAIQSTVIAAAFDNEIQVWNFIDSKASK